MISESTLNKKLSITLQINHILLNNQIKLFN